MTQVDIDRKAGVVILRDLELFNKAAIFFEKEIDPEVRQEITQAVDAWVEDHGWKAETDCSEEFKDLWVAPPQWAVEQDSNDYYAWFTLARRGDRESSSYEIANLFGVGDTEYGFQFDVAHGWFGGKGTWNAYAKNISDIIQKLAEQGFSHLGKGVFFKPLSLSLSGLLAAWESEDYAEVLMPLLETLDALEAAVPHFDALMSGGLPKKAE